MSFGIGVYSGGGVLGVLIIEGFITHFSLSGTAGLVGRRSDAVEEEADNVLAATDRTEADVRFGWVLNLVPVGVTSIGSRRWPCRCRSARSRLSARPSMVKFSEPALLIKDSRRLIIGGSKD